MKSASAMFLVFLLASGCVSLGLPEGPPYGRTLIESGPPGARIAINGQYVGPAPLRVDVPLFGPNAAETVVIQAYPVLPGQQIQTVVIPAGELMPTYLYFDLNLPPLPSPVLVTLPPPLQTQGFTGPVYFYEYEKRVKIAKLYRSLLEQEIDAVRLEHWMRLCRQGRSWDEVRRGMEESPEYRRKHPAASRPQGGRDPDASSRHFSAPGPRQEPGPAPRTFEGPKSEAVPPKEVPPPRFSPFGTPASDPADPRAELPVHPAPVPAPADPIGSVLPVLPASPPAVPMKPVLPPAPSRSEISASESKEIQPVYNLRTLPPSPPPRSEIRVPVPEGNPPRIPASTDEKSSVPSVIPPQRASDSGDRGRDDLPGKKPAPPAKRVLSQERTASRERPLKALSPSEQAES